VSPFLSLKAKLLNPCFSLKGNARRAHLGPTGKRRMAGPKQKTLDRREALVETSGSYSESHQLATLTTSSTAALPRQRRRRPPPHHVDPTPTPRRRDRQQRPPTSHRPPPRRDEDEDDDSHPTSKPTTTTTSRVAWTTTTATISGVASTTTSTTTSGVASTTTTTFHSPARLFIHVTPQIVPSSCPLPLSFAMCQGST